MLYLLDMWQVCAIVLQQKPVAFCTNRKICTAYALSLIVRLVDLAAHMVYTSVECRWVDGHEVASKTVQMLSSYN